MIKKFLVDFNKYKNINENRSEKFHPVFKDNLPGEDNPAGEFPIVTDKEIFTDKDNRPATEAEINFVANKNPKYKSYLQKFLNTSKFVLPFMAAVLLYNSTHLNSPEQKVAIEMIKQENQAENISPHQIENEPNIDNNEITTSSTKSSQSNEIQTKEKKKASKNKTSREEIKKQVSERIKEFESYRPYPYQDAEGISIGYGTQFINKGKVNDLQDDWKDIIYKKIGLSEKEIKEKEKNEKYKESVDEELDQYITELDERIKELKNKKDKVVNPYKDKKPKNWKPRYHFKKEFRNKLQKLINNLEKRKEVVKKRGVLKKDEAEECFKIDLENRFDILESNFKNPYIMDAEIIKVLLDMYYNIGPALESKFPDFIKHIESYHKEMSKKSPNLKKIKNILKEANKEISPKGAPVYHKQNKDRAESNQELIQIAINKYKTNESLKSVYKHLFV